MFMPHLVARILGYLIGFLYPAFMSMKALEKHDGTSRKWLVYWVCYSVVSIIELFEVFVSWFPFYYEAKMCFLFFLVYPLNDGSPVGAGIVYTYLVRPVLRQHADKNMHQAMRTLRKASQLMTNVGFAVARELATAAIDQSAADILSRVNETVGVARQKHLEPYVEVLDGVAVPPSRVWAVAQALDAREFDLDALKNGAIDRWVLHSAGVNPVDSARALSIPFLSRTRAKRQLGSKYHLLVKVENCVETTEASGVSSVIEGVWGWWSGRGGEGETQKVLYYVCVSVVDAKNNYQACTYRTCGCEYKRRLVGERSVAESVVDWGEDFVVPQLVGTDKVVFTLMSRTVTVDPDTGSVCGARVRSASAAGGASAASVGSDAAPSGCHSIGEPVPSDKVIGQAQYAVSQMLGDASDMTLLELVGQKRTEVCNLGGLSVVPVDARGRDCISREQVQKMKEATRNCSLTFSVCLLNGDE
eukprot:Rmarinus@m.6245